MQNRAVLRRAARARHAPRQRRRRNQHLSRRRSRLPHRIPRRPYARAAARSLIPVERARPRLLDLNLLPVGFQFLRQNHGQRRAHALPHLGARHHNRDLVVRSDPQISVRRKNFFARCSLRAAGKSQPPAPLPRPLQPQQIHAGLAGSSRTSSPPNQPGRAMNRLANPFIGPAAAQVAVHGLRDLLIARIRRLRQQSRRRHDLPRLAVAALRNFFGNPRLLQDVQPVRSQSFDGRDALSGNLRNRRGTRPNRRPLHMHRASPAEPGATTKFRSR